MWSEWSEYLSLGQEWWSSTIVPQSPNPGTLRPSAEISYPTSDPKTYWQKG